MSIVKKVSALIIIVALMFIISPQKANAGFSFQEMVDGGDSFISKGEADKHELFNEENEQSAVDQIYFVMLTIAIILAFIVGSVLGIQFITTGAAGQAKVKEKLVPFVVGAVVVFAGFGIWRVVYIALKGLF